MKIPLLPSFLNAISSSAEHLLQWAGRVVEPVAYECTSSANAPAAAVGGPRGHGCGSACSLQWPGAVFLSLTFFSKKKARELVKKKKIFKRRISKEKTEC